MLAHQYFFWTGFGGKATTPKPPVGGGKLHLQTFPDKSPRSVPAKSFIPFVAPETIQRLRHEVETDRQQLPVLSIEQQHQARKAIEVAAFHNAEIDAMDRLLSQLEQREAYFQLHLQGLQAEYQEALRERINSIWSKELQLQIWYRNAALLLLLN